MKETGKQIEYENDGYTVPVTDLSPAEARDYLTANGNDGLLERMPQDRRRNLEIRAGEKQ